MGKSVAVIGAGPMGLAVAYQLAKDGFQPVVFEADDRVGGMTATFDFDGVEIERYYHFHCTSDTAFFELLKELGIEKKLHWRKTKMSYWFGGKLQPWGNPIALLKFDGLSLVAKIRYGLHAFYSTKINNWKPLEKYDAMTWIKKWVGSEVYEKLWDKLLHLKFYEYSSNLSTPWMWSRIRRIGRSRYNLMSEKLGYVEGGSKTLLNGMKQFIEAHGGEFRLSTPIEEIVVEEDEGVKGVKAANEFIAFDRVISTIPLPYIPAIIPNISKNTLELFEQKENIGVVCVIARLSKPLTDSFWLNTVDENMDIPGIIEYGNLNPEVGHIVYVPYYMPQTNPKYHDSDEVFADKVSQYFQKINPAIKESDIESIKVHKYHYAQPICEPNYPDTLPQVEVSRGLWVADTTYYYPEDRGISESIGYGRALAKKVIGD
jgi:protoporphyrinogen oxidase